MAKTRLCTKCGSRRLNKFFKSHRARICTKCQKTRTRTYSRAVHLRETYGISMAEYDRMLKAQNGRCHICNGTRNYNLQVDHCHTTGLIRGLLCKQCNKRLLPAAKDSVDRLHAAINYLTNPPAFKVIGERVAACEL